MGRSNSVGLRFATIFGVSPKMRANLLVNEFVYRAVYERSLVIYDGNSTRTFLHINDAVNAYVLMLDKIDVTSGEVFNVGDETLNYSKYDISNQIKEFVDFEIITSSMPDFDERSFYISFDKIKKLGYTTSFTLTDGIKGLIQLYSFYKPHSELRVI